MTQIANGTVYSHFWFEKMGTEGDPFDILVVRGTFDLATEGAPVTLSEDQDPVCLADEYDGDPEGDPLGAVLLRDGDVVMFKPTTDVHVVGRAHAPGGQPATDWVASVTVGPLHKRLRLLGPRTFRRDGDGWILSSPTPIDSLALDYRLAFGGRFTVPAEELEESEQPVYMTKRDNPAGCGWLPSEEDLERISEEARELVQAQVEALEELPAPQIEDPEDPIRDPEQDSEAQGFGPMARWCAPRIDFAGTWDEAWKENRSPGFPEDFDAEFYQSAHPDLVAPDWLEGDESIVLEGVFPGGAARMRLPGRIVAVGGERQSGAIVRGRLPLDTVAIDLDRHKVSLVWRGTFAKADRVQLLEIADLTDHVGGGSPDPSPPAQEAQHG